MASGIAVWKVHRRLPSVYYQNALWLSISTPVTMAASLAYNIIAARSLGPRVYGRFALVIAVVGWFSAVAQGSGTTVLTVQAAKAPSSARQLVRPGITVQAAFGLAGFLPSIWILWLIGRDSRLLLPAVIAGVGNVAYLVTSVPIALHRGSDRMSWGGLLAACSVATVWFALLGAALRPG